MPKPEYTTGGPLPEREIASDANLSLWALEGQARIEQDERDPFAMTHDKLAAKIPGMATAALQIDDPSYARFREEDEELLKAEQAAYREANPE